jgi:Amt family ammonium transporter
VTTNTAAAAAALVWMLLSWKDKPAQRIGHRHRRGGGLVAITPAAGFVTPIGAM